MVAGLTAIFVLGGCGNSQVSFYIPSCANYPTLQPGYHIVLEKPAKSVSRADFVVYHSPLVRTPGGTAVARVVGLAGETVQARGGQILVNGKPLGEPYLAPGTKTADFGPVNVPTGHYFLLGDNRSNSADSRAFGPVDASAVVAKVTSVKKGKASANGIQPSDCQL
jgi:signal peptidase I